MTTKYKTQRVFSFNISLDITFDHLILPRPVYTWHAHYTFNNKSSFSTLFNIQNVFYTFVQCAFLEGDDQRAIPIISKSYTNKRE